MKTTEGNHVAQVSKLTIIVFVFLFTLNGCGGSSGGSDSEEEIDTNCVIGTSKIGDCKI